MVFSMASIPMTELSSLMCAKISSKVSQQMSSISSFGKNLCAAMSWNEPGTPCIAILFIISLFNKKSRLNQKRDLSLVSFHLSFLNVHIHIPASLFFDKVKVKKEKEEICRIYCCHNFNLFLFDVSHGANVMLF